MAARPPSQFNLIQATNGSPVFLGMLVSTGAAVNNLTTATPFNQTGLGPAGAIVPGQTQTLANLQGTLAGKVLLLQASAAGLILPSLSSSMTVNPNSSIIIALQTVVPPLAGTVPGVALTAGERVELTMGANEGWLQWLPVTGSANCLVWELR